MSTVAVPPFLWSQGGDFDAPVEYTVPGSGEVQPYTATATYVNNSGQAILPALRLRSASGNLLALVFPSGQIADGGSAEVTFLPPFGSAASGNGIQFDTDPQTGDYLHVETTGVDPLSSEGIGLHATGGGRLRLETTDAGTIDVQANGGGSLLLTVDGAGGMILTEDGGGVIIHETGAGGTQILDAGGGMIIAETGGGGLSITESGGGGFTMAETGGGLMAASSDGGYRFAIAAAGKQLLVTNHLLAPIFEIREDGSIHGLASVGAITWDL